MRLRRSPLKPDRWLLAGTALLALLLLASVLNFVTTEQQHDDAEWVSHTQEVLTTLEAFRSELAASGAALRGHVLSGRGEDLAAYRLRADRSRAQLDRFAALTGDNPRHQAALPTLRADLAEVARLREASIDALRAGGLERSVQLFLVAGGPALLERLDDRVNALAEHERGLLAQRRRSSERAYQVSLWTGIGSGLLSILFVGLYFVALRQHARSRTEAAERLAQLSEALQDADRKKDAFIATLAHELRNPLAPIGNASEILSRQAGDPAKVRWAADLVRRQVGHMRVLLDDLLDVARITQGKLRLDRRPVALDEVLDTALEVSRIALEPRQHRLTVTRPPAGVQVDVDLVRITQAVTNLLNNAARYTDPCGEVALHASLDGGDLHIRVCDSGIGLTPEAQRRIFEPFEQVAPTSDRSQGGLGIGLALTRGLVELHGGRISVHSDGPQQGSTFSVVLPGVVLPGQAASRGPVPQAAALAAPP